MARHSDEDPRAPRRRTPARTPEEHESLLISKSLRLIEQQIDDGSISAAVLSIYARASTEKDRLEKERLRGENAVLHKKLETMEAAVDIKNLMENALDAFRGYSGDIDPANDEDYDY